MRTSVAVLGTGIMGAAIVRNLAVKDVDLALEAADGATSPLPAASSHRW